MIVCCLVCFYTFFGLVSQARPGLSTVGVVAIVWQWDHHNDFLPFFGGVWTLLQDTFFLFITCSFSLVFPFWECQHAQKVHHTCTHFAHMRCSFSDVLLFVCCATSVICLSCFVVLFIQLAFVAIVHYDPSFACRVGFLFCVHFARRRETKPKALVVCLSLSLSLSLSTPQVPLHNIYPQQILF